MFEEQIRYDNLVKELEDANATVEHVQKVNETKEDLSILFETSGCKNQICKALEVLFPASLTDLNNRTYGYLVAERTIK